MAEPTAPNYPESLSQALAARKDWLEKTELGQLKDNLRAYQASFSALYNIFLKKKLINEDPYKQETKISELEVPETGAFNEAKRMEQLSLRLSTFDSQLDFLVNFYQFGVDFLNIERLKRILGLVRYIDWVALTPDSQSHNTKLVAEITAQSKTGVDQITLSIIGESLTKLAKSTAAVVAILRDLSSFYKETYKLKVRSFIAGMPAADANPANIRKKIAASQQGFPFHQEFVDEIIKEDFSKDGAALQEAVLKSLKVAEEKPKAVKPTINFKAILLEGIQVIGSSAGALTEVAVKIDENEGVLANQKKSFWQKIRQLIRAMTNAAPEEVVYDIQYMDTSKGVMVKTKLSYFQFRADMDKKIRVLTGMGGRGPVMAKLNSMSEEQITGYLERTIRDVQSLHRTLSALDEFFKSETPQSDRERVRGIKPELATIKNSIVRANQLRHEYSAQKEEEEQLRKLGVTTPGA